MMTSVVGDAVDIIKGKCPIPIENIIKPIFASPLILKH